jgi:hypothetical protein
MHSLQPYSVETLVLDLEGTLISNAVSQFPRPGLFEFLELCRSCFSNVLIYSGVREEKYRSVAAQLIVDNQAPRWFSGLQHEHWIGDYKDLRVLDGMSLGTMVIVDDQEECIHPEQRKRWIRIKEFEAPYSSDDCELERIAFILANLAAVKHDGAV